MATTTLASRPSTNSRHRLTHIELSVILDSHGLVQRLARTSRLTEHAIRSELQGFKAYAELWQNEEDLDEPEPEAEARRRPRTARRGRKTRGPRQRMRTGDRGRG